MKVLLIGGAGQLGADLRRTNPGHALSAPDRRELDAADGPAVLRAVRDLAPEVVINAAAYNRTEDAEDDPEAAFRTNVLGPRHLASAAQQSGARFVHFGSDYVFDGRKGAPYVESDLPAPLGVYGLSKLGGDHMALAYAEDALVVRTAGLFGAAGAGGKGGNFLEAVIRRAREGKSVKVVDDMVMSPTYTLDLASMTWALLKASAPGGIYHVTNGGSCSWYEFAKVAFSLMGFAVSPEPVPSSAWPSKVRRPGYSVLASERLGPLGIKPLRHWEEALAAYLKEKGYLSR